MALFSLLTALLPAIILYANGYDWCPQYHLIRASNVYDPSGPIYYDNTWHVFEDSCGWCHFESLDLLHWKQLPNTQFSGLTGSVTAIANNQFVAFYPSRKQSGIIRAVSNDSMLLNWENTGMIIQKANNNTSNFRDPLRPLQINENIYIGVGSGIEPNGPGQLLFYQAINTDLSQFELIGSLLNVSASDGCIDANTMIYNPSNSEQIKAIECPDVFLIQDKYVIIASLFCTNEYWIGNINTNTMTFTAEAHSLLDYGNFYAAKTGTTAYGVNGINRRVLFGFTGWNEPTAPSACGRSHVIPRDIGLNDDGTLNIAPIDEIKNIRSGNNSNGYKGSELQLILSCDIKEALPTMGNISFGLMASSDNLEYTMIGYSFESDVFFVDHRKCCGDNKDIVQIAPYDRNKVIEKGLYFNVLLDRSIIEAFFNEEKVITAMINPSNRTAPDDRTSFFDNQFSTNFDCYFESWQLAL